MYTFGTISHLHPFQISVLPDLVDGDQQTAQKEESEMIPRDIQQESQGLLPQYFDPTVSDTLSSQPPFSYPAAHEIVKPTSPSPKSASTLQSTLHSNKVGSSPVRRIGAKQSDVTDSGKDEVSQLCENQDGKDPRERKGSPSIELNMSSSDAIEKQRIMLGRSLEDEKPTSEGREPTNSHEPQEIRSSEIEYKPSQARKFQRQNYGMPASYEIQSEPRLMSIEEKSTTNAQQTHDLLPSSEGCLLQETSGKATEMLVVSENRKRKIVGKQEDHGKEDSTFYEPPSSSEGSEDSLDRRMELAFAEQENDDNDPFKGHS